MKALLIRGATRGSAAPPEPPDLPPSEIPRAAGPTTTHLGVAVNRITTPANTRWKLVDRATGDENHGIR